MKELDSIAYGIIEECKCGPEELFVLISSVYPGEQQEIDNFIKTIAKLNQNGLLICRNANSSKEITVNYQALKFYVTLREEAGEKLDEYPIVCEEYVFEATDLGISNLSEKDKPV